ncbi:Actin-related protein 2/3 complex subunit 4 [Hypsizygus marmoreus]|uniref:Actin-related protein 2/3 complex subunit 4 n=1 Tax=Hypsizygus marmoreus TaxID=39966 RepID=A0A369JLI7_HYPMA|nr:Actin-related protein 2/3 complex subunit 4 [Hypsizygus marmoreus]
MQRAESFIVRRTKPVEVSTSMIAHNEGLIFAEGFTEEVDKEISEMKLSFNARARIVSESYLTAFNA